MRSSLSYDNNRTKKKRIFKMRLTLKNTPRQVELIRAMGSKNQIVAREAAEAFAAFIGPVVQQVIYQAGTASAIYTDAPFDEDDSPSYPLDLYYNEGANFVTVWSQSAAGGLPSSHVEGLEEMKISTYRLDSAVSFNKRYARRARLDVVSKAIERMANEVLVKQERNAWAVILKALAEASTKDGGGGSPWQHVVKSPDSTSVFQLARLNEIMTRMRRINESYAGGTPANPYSKGLTDLYLSPERMADIRGFAYNAVGGNTTDATKGYGGEMTDLPESAREDIYRNAGASAIFGVSLHEMNEFGVNKKYNTLFGTMAGATSYTEADGTGGETFATATDEIIVGIDNSKGSFVRPIARHAETGSTFQALPDDQYNITRADKAGFYGALEEGRVCLDSRAIVGSFLDGDA
jgi:hypothetical protein